MYSQNFNQPHDQQPAKPSNEYQQPVPQYQIGAPNAYYAGHTLVPQQPFNPQMAPAPMQAVPDSTILDSAYLVYLFDCLVPLLMIIAFFFEANSRHRQDVAGYAIIPALYIALVAWMWRITLNNPPGASRKVYCFLVMRWMLFGFVSLYCCFIVVVVSIITSLGDRPVGNSSSFLILFPLGAIAYFVAYAFSQMRLAKIVHQMKLQETMRISLGFGANYMNATI